MHTMEITSVLLLNNWLRRLCCLDAGEELIIWADANIGQLDKEKKKEPQKSYLLTPDMKTASSALRDHLLLISK